MTYEEEIALYQTVQNAVMNDSKAVSIINNAMMSGYEKRIDKLEKSQLTMETISSLLMISKGNVKERNKLIANKLNELEGDTFFNWSNYIEEHTSSNE